MPTDYAGVLAVPLILGLVEVAKRAGLSVAFAAPLAMALGVLLAVGWQAATVVAGAEPWAQSLIWGVALGLSASGLYSGAKKVAEGSED